MRGGREGRVREHTVVDHNVLAWGSGVDFGEASGARNLLCARRVCRDQQATVVDTDGDAEGALQRSKSCRTKCR